MKTIFDSQTKDELISRIKLLTANSQPAWGKMNAYQMLKHCTLSEEMLQGKQQYKRLFMGKLFGGMVLKSVLKNETPIKKNQPTHPLLKITGSGNFEQERSKWIALLQDYDHFSNTAFIHPFFGKMTTDEIGRYTYKHIDHHLRQFSH